MKQEIEEEEFDKLVSYSHTIKITAAPVTQPMTRRMIHERNSSLSQKGRRMSTKDRGSPSTVLARLNTIQLSSENNGRKSLLENDIDLKSKIENILITPPISPLLFTVNQVTPIEDIVTTTVDLVTPTVDQVTESIINQLKKNELEMKRILNLQNYQIEVLLLAQERTDNEFENLKSKVFQICFTLDFKLGKSVEIEFKINCFYSNNFSISKSKS